MPITKDELLDVITEASYRLHIGVKEAYNSGRLDDYLSMLGMD